MAPNLLLDLPAELRNTVYAFAAVYVLDVIKDIKDCISNTVLEARYDKHGSSLMPPPLARVSRQLRHEVIPIYYSKNKFCITIPTTLGSAHAAFITRCNFVKEFFPLIRSLHSVLDRMSMQPVDMMDWVTKIGERPDLSEW
ncbi:hypothetical protein F5Y08DRAFT_341804 [Xylaria arbuscula]|nr:hypothetical protein F5Y08DRAFT_341804 [Xylaria arbuscula]